MNKTVNFLNETLEVLKDHNINIDDIKYCRAGNYYFTWKEFEKIADLEYEPSSHAYVVINSDLEIVCEKLILERFNYDNSEWWIVKYLPEQKEFTGPPISLRNGYFIDKIPEEKKQNEHRRIGRKSESVNKRN